MEDNENKYTIDNSQIEASIIDDEILKEKIEPFKQQMKNAEISFDEYTNIYNKLYIERYNEIENEKNSTNHDTDNENTNNNANAMKKKLLVSIIIVTICLIVGITIAVIIKNNKSKCPSDYKLSDNLCTKIEVTEPNVNKYCIEGYQLENDTCTKIETVAPTIKYYCDNTYKIYNGLIASESTLAGSICSYTISHDPIQKRTCLPGATPYNDTKCRITITLNAASRIDVYTGKIMYYCAGDAELSGTNCLVYGYSDYIYENICVEDYILINNKCVKNYTYNAGWEATCPNDYTYIDQNTCTKKITTNVQYNYDCPSGYTTNKNGNTGLEVPELDVPGLEVPELDVPGVDKKCYKKITMPPHK